MSPRFDILKQQARHLLAELPKWTIVHEFSSHFDYPEMDMYSIATDGTWTCLANETAWQHCEVIIAQSVAVMSKVQHPNWLPGRVGSEPSSIMANDTDSALISPTWLLEADSSHLPIRISRTPACHKTSTHTSKRPLQNAPAADWLCSLGA